MMFAPENARAKTQYAFLTLAFLVVTSIVFFGYLTDTKLGKRFSGGLTFQAPQDLKITPTSASIKAIQFNSERTLDLFYQQKVNQEIVEAVIEPQVTLCDSGLTVLALVVSSADSFEHRDSIRESWANYDFIGSDLRVVFVTGQFSKPDRPRVHALIKSESLKHRDILQVASDDSEHNTESTRRIQVGAGTLLQGEIRAQGRRKHGGQFTPACQVFEEVCKKETDRMGQVIFGDLRVNSTVNRNTDTYDFLTTEEFPHSVHYPFCDKSAYLLSQQLLRSVHNLSQYVQWPPFSKKYDDMFVGALAVNLGAHFVNTSDSHVMYSAPKEMLLNPNHTLFVLTINAYELKRVWRRLNPDKSNALVITNPRVNETKLLHCKTRLSQSKFGMIRFNGKDLFVIGNETVYQTKTRFHDQSKCGRMCRGTSVAHSGHGHHRTGSVRTTSELFATPGPELENQVSGKLRVVYVVGTSTNRTVNRLVQQEHASATARFTTNRLCRLLL
jgi:hypothetical protein